MQILITYFDKIAIPVDLLLVLLHVFSCLVDFAVTFALFVEFCVLFQMFGFIEINLVFLEFKSWF